MSPAEVAGAVVGGLVGLAALLTAVRTIRNGIVGTFRWVRRAVRSVQIITELPARLTAQDEVLARVKTDLWEHVSYSEGRNALLDALAREQKVLLGISRDVHHEVKHNGGSSIKDAVSRIETGVKGLYTPATTSTGPVAVIIPTPIVKEATK